MNPSTLDTPWRGRTDTEEMGDVRRWHQVMQPLNDLSSSSPHIASTSPSGQKPFHGIALLGFPVDEGVQRNGGRPGAAQGPSALRAALANMPLRGEPPLFDAGDLFGNVISESTTNRCETKLPQEALPLEAAQRLLAERVTALRQRNLLPLVLGGGHEVAFGTFCGLAASLPTSARIAIVNFDAHFDLRLAETANSGTPFRQIAERCQQDGRVFDYSVLGISVFANTRALFERAHKLGVRYWLDTQLQCSTQIQNCGEALTAHLDGADTAYLTVCLDVLPGEKAPGVSAPATLGVPLAFLEQLVDIVLKTGKVGAADIAELNPLFDRDGLTAKVAARLVARIAGHQASACYQP